MISANINKYIENSKIRGKLCRWKKSTITVHITPIVASINNKELMYSFIEKAIYNWNEYLRANHIPIQFQTINQPHQADIIILWTKVGRVFEGMCKYVSVINDELKKISIDIGLPNEFSGKDTTDLSIYCTIMHELGHALGLGHGVEVDDIMYVPHQKNIQNPSNNDIYVLKQIYYSSSGCEPE